MFAESGARILLFVMVGLVRPSSHQLAAALLARWILGTSPRMTSVWSADSAYWLMYQPPLGERTWPVTNLASSLAR